MIYLVRAIQIIRTFTRRLCLAGKSREAARNKANAAFSAAVLLVVEPHFRATRTHKGRGKCPDDPPALVTENSPSRVFRHRGSTC